MALAHFETGPGLRFLNPVPTARNPADARAAKESRAPGSKDAWGGPSASSPSKPSGFCLVLVERDNWVPGPPRGMIQQARMVSDVRSTSESDGPTLLRGKGSKTWPGADMALGCSKKDVTSSAIKNFLKRGCGQNSARPTEETTAQPAPSRKTVQSSASSSRKTVQSAGGTVSSRSTVLQASRSSSAHQGPAPPRRGTCMPTKSGLNPARPSEFMRTNANDGTSHRASEWAQAGARPSMNVRRSLNACKKAMLHLSDPMDLEKKDSASESSQASGSPRVMRRASLRRSGGTRTSEDYDDEASGALRSLTAEDSQTPQNAEDQMHEEADGVQAKYSVVGSRNTKFMQCPKFNNSLPERLKRLTMLQRDRQRVTVDAQTIKRKRFENMKESEVATLRQVFELYDKDGSNSLDLSELRFCLTEMGLRGRDTLEKQEITRLCKEVVAAQEEGAVDFFEFATDLVPRVRARLQETRSESMMQMFMRIDTTGSGQLPYDDVVRLGLMMGISPTVIEEVEQELAAERSPKKERATRRTKVVKMKAKGSIISDSPPQTPTQGATSKPMLDVDSFLRLLLRCQERSQRIGRVQERDVEQEFAVDTQTFKVFRREIAALAESFKRFDSDDSGALDAGEVLAVFTEFGLIPRTQRERERVQNIVGSADKDGDGTVNFVEFLHLIQEVRQHLQDRKRDDLREMFQRLDKDNSGQLSVVEISQLLLELELAPKTVEEQAEIKVLLEDCDMDGSGEINFEEFQVLVQRVAEKLSAMQFEQYLEEATRLGFNETQMREFRHAFDRLDEDGSDSLDCNEVRHALTMLRVVVKPDKFRDAFLVVDKDGSGAVDFMEFLTLMAMVKEQSSLLTEDAGLPRKFEWIDVRVLRRILEYFYLSKDYIKSLNKKELVTFVSDYFGVKADADIHDAFGINNLDDLYATAKRKGEQMKR